MYYVMRYIRINYYYYYYYYYYYALIQLFVIFLVVLSAPLDYWIERVGARLSVGVRDWRPSQLRAKFQVVQWKATAAKGNRYWTGIMTRVRAAGKFRRKKESQGQTLWSALLRGTHLPNRWLLSLWKIIEPVKRYSRQLHGLQFSFLGISQTSHSVRHKIFLFMYSCWCSGYKKNPRFLKTVNTKRRNV